MSENHKQKPQDGSLGVLHVMFISVFHDLGRFGFQENMILMLFDPLMYSYLMVINYKLSKVSTLTCCHNDRFCRFHRTP